MSDEDEVVEDRGDVIDLDEDELENEDEVIEEEDQDEDEEGLDEDDEDQSEDDQEDEDQEDEDQGDRGEESDEEGEDEVEEEDKRIPRSRLNQVIKQRDEEKQRSIWLEQQLERLIENGTKKEVKEEEEVEKPPEYDFDTSEEKYVDLLIEGDTKGAAALRREINKAQQASFEHKFKIVKEEAQQTAKTESTESIEQDRFDSLVDNYENKHSFLDLDSDDYNEEAVETVNTLMAGFQAQGKTKSQALKAAVTKVAPMYKKESPKVEPRKKGLGNRKQVARKKAAKASQQQPAKNSGKKTADRDLDELSISSLSEKDFNSLSEKEKKILRGD